MHTSAAACPLEGPASMCGRYVTLDEASSVAESPLPLVRVRAKSARANLDDATHTSSIAKS